MSWMTYTKIDEFLLYFELHDYTFVFTHGIFVHAPMIPFFDQSAFHN